MEVEDKFAKVDNDKKATTALPAWSDVYYLGDLPNYFKAAKFNENFFLSVGSPGLELSITYPFHWR